MHLRSIAALLLCLPACQRAPGNDERLTQLWGRVSNPPSAVPEDTFLGFYYADAPGQPGTLIGMRTDPRIAFDWGTGAPMAGAPADGFSVYWVGNLHFVAGTHRFAATADDAMRVYVDGLPVLDAGSAPVDLELTEGLHLVQVLYVEDTGSASAHLDMTLLAMPAAPGWRNTPFAPLGGVVQVDFDATPSADSIHSLSGVSGGPAADYEDLAAVVRFSSSGKLEARDGAGGQNYRADVDLPYVGGQRYHVRFMLSFAAKKYDVYVTPPGLPEQALALGYAFPPQQAALASAGNLGTWSESATHLVENLRAQEVTPPVTTPPAGYQPLIIPPGSAVFYVDAQSGDDANDGRTDARAWKTMGRAAQGDVGSGAFVLFKRGQAFSGEVVPQNEGITYGAFGTGPRPVLGSGGMLQSAFRFTGVSHFTVRDLDIVGYWGPGITLEGTGDITVYNVHFTDDGSDGNGGAMMGHGVDGLTVEHITAERIYGDGIGIWGGANVKVLHSYILPVDGWYADNIHLNGVDGAEVRGNWFEMGGTSSGKGNVCFCGDTHVVAADNVGIGGNYGLSGDGDHFLYEHNWLENNDGESWSYTFGWGGEPGRDQGMTDVTIRENTVVHGGIGVAAFFNNIDSTKDDLQVYGNTFVDTGTMFATWGATFTNSSIHDNSLFATPSSSVGGITMQNNAQLPARPALTRPDRGDRGAF